MIAIKINKKINFKILKINKQEFKNILKVE